MQKRVLEREDSIEVSGATVAPLEPIWSFVSGFGAVFIVGLYLCVVFHRGEAAFLTALTVGPLFLRGIVAIAAKVAPLKSLTVPTNPS